MVEAVCCGNCNLCENDVCCYESPMIGAEYDLARELDNTILRERLQKPITMDKYIHNRPDKEAYTRERDRVLEHNRYKRNIEKRREVSRQQYYKNRTRVIERQKSYYQENKEELRVKSHERYQNNKDSINEKRRQKYAQEHPKKPKQSYEEHLAKMREYRLLHRDEINRKKREAYHRKKQEEV